MGSGWGWSGRGERPEAAARVQVGDNEVLNCDVDMGQKEEERKVHMGNEEVRGDEVESAGSSLGT